MDRTLAETCGLRRVWPHNIASIQRSDENANSPRTLGMPSGRLSEFPIPAALLSVKVALAGGIGAPRLHVSDRFEDPSVAGAAAEVS